MCQAHYNSSPTPITSPMPLTSLQNGASWDEKKNETVDGCHSSTLTRYSIAGSYCIMVSACYIAGAFVWYWKYIDIANWKLITRSKQNLWPWGVGIGYGVTVSSRETFPRLRVYAVRPMLATFVCIQLLSKLHRWRVWGNCFITKDISTSTGVCR